jgi:uncharacterized repeat protein (TIGR02543 family)
LLPASKENATFTGWYENETFTGDAVTEIAKGSTGDIALWAKYEMQLVPD